MAEIPKETVSARVGVDVLERIDKLAETEGRSRSEIIARLISSGLKVEEDVMADASHPIKGRVIQLLMNPKVLASLEYLAGEKADPDRVETLRYVNKYARNKKKQS